MGSMGALISLTMLIGVISIGVMFGIGVFGAADQGVNMTGSDYEEEYAAVQSVQIQTFDMMAFIPTILAIAAIIVAILFIKSQM